MNPTTAPTKSITISRCSPCMKMGSKECSNIFCNEVIKHVHSEPNKCGTCMATIGDKVMYAPLGDTINLEWYAYVPNESLTGRVYYLESPFRQ